MLICLKKLQVGKWNHGGATTTDVRNDGYYGISSTSPDPLFQHNDAKIIQGWILIFEIWEIYQDLMAPHIIVGHKDTFICQKINALDTSPVFTKRNGNQSRDHVRSVQHSEVSCCIWDFEVVSWTWRLACLHTFGELKYMSKSDHSLDYKWMCYQNILKL